MVDDLNEEVGAEDESGISDLFGGDECDMNESGLVREATNALLMEELDRLARSSGEELYVADSCELFRNIAGGLGRKLDRAGSSVSPSQ